MNKRIGIFVDGSLVNSYENKPEKYVEAAKDVLECIEETDMFHELKIYTVNDETK